MDWPGGKKFAFTIVDDTDNATVENTKPIYDYLLKKGIRTTKTVWPFRPRGHYDGQSLCDLHYRNWILDLKSSGVEIALHGVGDGFFSRKEIAEGIKIFKEILGYPPKIHCNHGSNPDNLYWWSKRFEWPFSAFYELAYRLKRRAPPPEGGDAIDSSCFWGDYASREVTYVRNLTFASVDTLSRDSKMPYHDEKKPYVNYWFSSSDGHNIKLFNDLLSPMNLNKLQRNGGGCIVYTHFASGFVESDGSLNSEFKKRVDDLAARNAWFVPCGELLDYLRGTGHSRAVSSPYKLSLNVMWGVERLKKTVKYGM